MKTTLKNILCIGFLFPATASLLFSCHKTKHAVYGKLDKKKYYKVHLSRYQSGETTVYKVAGKEVSEKEFLRYEKLHKNMRKCTPCILQSFDANDRLLEEGIAYKDCYAGWFKKYGPEGNLKVKGHYKENKSGNWENIWENGFCNVKDGKWTYFNSSGDSLYLEYWEEGRFIQQYPEQDKAEIWKVEPVLNKVNIENKKFEFRNLSQIRFVPYFKNSNHNIDLLLHLKLSGDNSTTFEKTFTPEAYAEIDFRELLKAIKKDPPSNVRPRPRIIELDISVVTTDGARMDHFSWQFMRE